VRVAWSAISAAVLVSFIVFAVHNLASVAATTTTPTTSYIGYGNDYSYTITPYDDRAMSLEPTYWNRSSISDVDDVIPVNVLPFIDLEFTFAYFGVNQTKIGLDPNAALQFTNRSRPNSFVTYIDTNIIAMAVTDLYPGNDVAPDRQQYNFTGGPSAIYYSSSPNIFIFKMMNIPLFVTRPDQFVSLLDTYRYNIDTELYPNGRFVTIHSLHLAT
jgi:hypothetical protein